MVLGLNGEYSHFTPQGPLQAVTGSDALRGEGAGADESQLGDGGEEGRVGRGEEDVVVLVLLEVPP